MTSSFKNNSMGMLLDGVFASEAIDSSGEILDIKGLDTTDFDEGKGLANYEHKDSSGDSNGQEIVGKVIYSRKIFKESDCTSDRERLFWSRTKVPFLYGVVRLYDGAGHDGAKSLAASVRDSVANEEPIILGFSIEGSTLERKENRLLNTVARKVALTYKSCNKQAVSGVLADPHAPAGFDKNPEKAEKSEKMTDPLNMRLGGTEAEYSPDMMKALSAGSYNAAPGTLTGGAALQKESRDKKLTAVAKAAARDWPKTGKFRDYLKSQIDKAELGDVSDEFMDHFSDLVESKYYRIKKTEEVLADLKKAGKEPKKPVPTPKPESIYTNNGQPVKPNRKLTEPRFDENKGILHLPQGSFPVYIPSRDTPELASKFHEILNDPKVDKFHGEAMDNWLKAHKLMKAGKTPPEVLMHSVLFSQLSPNTPVPMQELMYGHLVDSMKSTGKTPLDPDFASTKSDWMSRDSADKFPDHSPEHWKRLENTLRLGSDSKLTGRTKGDIGSFMLANDKFDNMSKYSKMHSGLVDLVSRHKGDARSIVEEMMYHKNEQIKWDNRLRLGSKTTTGEYPGLQLPGLAPKTARYAIAMAGGGNIVVPDTHFVRNLFGLNRDLDSHSIKLIKSALWNEKNSSIMSGIDRFYAKNHDAVKHILQHPKWSGQFQSPEDANFPAFWKHWMSIVPHEQARGHKAYGYNELTDHRPFWEAIEPFLGKSEGMSNLPLETAKQHAQWQLQYGEMPAQLLYYKHLLPRLLSAAGARESQRIVRKAQELHVEALTKALPWDEPDSKAAQDPEEVEFQGRRSKPGEAFVQHGGEFHRYVLLGHDNTHFYGVKDDEDSTGHNPVMDGWGPEHVHKLARTDPGLDVRSYPQTLDNPLEVDADAHGISDFVSHPHSRELAHGFNFGWPTEGEQRGFSALKGDSYWATSPAGKKIFVKRSTKAMDNATTEGVFNTARREGAYHNVAHDVFGLGHALPAVAVVRHPQTGQEHALIEHVDSTPAEYDWESGALKNSDPHQKLADSGELHKLALMDHVMGNYDRHAGNWLYRKDGKGLVLIDHNIYGRQFGEHGTTPTYLRDEDLHAPVHPEALKWLKGLDPGKLNTELHRYGVPQGDIHGATERLKKLQESAHLHSTLNGAMIDSNSLATFQSDPTEPKHNKPWVGSSSDSQSPYDEYNDWSKI